MQNFVNSIQMDMRIIISTLNAYNYIQEDKLIYS
jgi:hypothetical protein